MTTSVLAAPPRSIAAPRSVPAPAGPRSRASCDRPVRRGLTVHCPVAVPVHRMVPPRVTVYVPASASASRAVAKRPRRVPGGGPIPVTARPDVPAVKSAVGARLAGGGPTSIRKVSVPGPAVGTNAAVSAVSVARTSSIPKVGPEFNPENRAK